MDRFILRNKEIELAIIKYIIFDLLVNDMYIYLTCSELKEDCFDEFLPPSSQPAVMPFLSPLLLPAAAALPFPPPFTIIGVRP